MHAKVLLLAAHRGFLLITMCLHKQGTRCEESNHFL
jgi:hypothetical protein